MNVNGLTGLAAKQTIASKNKSTQSVKFSEKTKSGGSVSLSQVDQGKMLQLIADKSLQKIMDMARFAAQALGYDLNNLGALDTSVEGTSSRIADFAVGLFGLYKQQNPDMSEEEALVEYESLIKGAVGSGYQEALHVLSGLGVNDQKILDTAQETINMTFQKLDNFFNAKREELAQAQAQAQAQTPTLPEE